MKNIVGYVLIAVLMCISVDVHGDVQAPYRYPTKCEVCKIFANELRDRLEVSGKRKEVFRLGQGLDDAKKRSVNYAKSELRLVEAIHEPHICDEVKKYNVHAERVGSLRYAKGMSETMETLHGLKNKGVKVDLGIPYELWDAPNAEVGQMTRECYSIVEDHEEDIEKWYWGDQTKDVVDYLCREIVLKGTETECLGEIWTGREKIDNSKEKGDGGIKMSGNSNEERDEL